MSIYTLRKWMYTRKDSEGALTKEFKDGLEIFMYQAENMQTTLESGKMFCPCPKCENTRYIFAETVWKHLLNRGFMPHYYVWYQHGEGFERSQTDEGTSNYQGHVDVDESNYHGQHGQDHDRIHDMVNDAFRDTNADNSVEEPNVDAKLFYDMLDAANKPIYHGCREGLSKLSLAARMMTIKSDHNLSEVCMDDWADVIKEYLPEDNVAAETYYEIQKLVWSLGLPSEMIDVCVDNCMLFWKDDEKLQECRYCQKPRFRPQTSGRSQIPYHRMWYLPITDRLKRLYQSERTAASMRWHAEHSQIEGEVTHPSDAKAWKHFKTVHPEFAKFRRNVYLGLCTDGFSPFSSSGRKYSLWPVVVTPYNLPPDMCMQREFLFLNILVPGPNHPKRSLDVFLQPLVNELKQLWYTGVRTYDCSTKKKFTMRAVLMWTISDFPAYGMLSGWTTHGRLSCPYCLNRTDAFQLKHGRKTCWFDCHRRFLPINHPYRRNRRNFIKNKIVRVPPPVYLSGEDIEAQIDYVGAQETVIRGGNWHTPGNMPDGYGENHNWHKKSIFWELPYWKDHLLRHNLDVMHIEKNFFDNIMHTVLNVKGRTKDNEKSRLDLPDICNRNELHILVGGESPVPIFRLGADEKAALFNWVSSDVKFPDGYVSNLAKSVEKAKKFSGMKSHDCHVFMQRLLPFAFAELLPVNVHEAIGGIGAFFRDLCTRTLSEDVIAQLDANIPILLCNLEKIFPPSFFDVMEHLPIHLPHEAELGGPVQFRWMYPFERFFKYLKGKAKNLAKPEGSVVAGSLTAETSHFVSYYFGSKVRTRKRRPRRYDDGGVGRTYAVEGVPDVFSPIGRLSGTLKEVCWSDGNDRHSAHTYILLNCEEIDPYESLFVTQVRESKEGISDEGVNRCKDRYFAKWLKSQVDYGDPAYPIWFHELLLGPLGKITTAPMYFTRGYVFHTYTYGVHRATANYGVCVRGEIDFYGVLQEIIEVEYPGLVRMKCVLFKCEWFDPTDRGTRVNKFGVVDVNSSRRYNKFEPFILASQAEQVTFVPYPRVRTSGPKWLSVIKIAPRGQIVGVDDLAMQQDSCPLFSEPEITDDDVLLIDPHNRQVEYLPHDDTEEEGDSDEFEESDDEVETEDDERNEDDESDEDDDL